MKLHLVILLCVIHFGFQAQTTTTVYKNKSGNTVGSAKQKGNQTTYYNKSGNKTGSAKRVLPNTTVYYNKSGNKVGISKTK